MDVEEGSRKFEEKNFYEKLTLIPSQNVGFWPNSTPKASSKGEGCPSLMYFNLTLSLADVGFGFFFNTPLTPNTSWAWCMDNMVGDPLN